MANFNLLSPHSLLNHHHRQQPAAADKILNINFTQIPSWISLENKPNTFIEQQKGKLENVHLLSLSKQRKLKQAYHFILQVDPSNVPVSPQSYKHLLQMRDFGIGANEVTFVVVLTAYSHNGLVEEAETFLQTMSMDHGIEPTIDHYDYMIDIYSRVGLLNDAFDLIMKIPFEPDAMSWKSLLGGCSIYRNEIGKIAGEKLLELDPNDTVAYILMFNMYASSGMWDEASSIRKLMAGRDLKKEIGCSWITVKNKVHRFIVVIDTILKWKRFTQSCRN